MLREMTSLNLGRDGQGTVAEVAKLDELGPPGGRIAHGDQVARYRWVCALVSDKDVLDLGRSLAHGPRMIAAAGARSVVGVDPSTQASLHAAGRSREPKLVAAELDALPFADESFDLAVCFADPTEPAPVLRELRRVLRPKGVAVVCLSGLSPGQLERLLLDVFAACRIERQQLCAASVIGENAAVAHGIDGQLHGRPTAVIALAGDHGLPSTPGIALLTDTHEVEVWRQRLEQLDAELHATRRQLEASRARDDERAARLRQVAATLESASSENSDVLQLRQRVAELELELEAARGLGRALDEIRNSRSWRLTRPLRAAMRPLRRG